MTLRDNDLEASLGALRRADVPSDLTDAVMHRVLRERRPLGLGRREWAFVGAALGTFTVALQIVVSVVTSMMPPL